MQITEKLQKDNKIFFSKTEVEDVKKNSILHIHHIIDSITLESEVFNSFNKLIWIRLQEICDKNWNVVSYEILSSLKKIDKKSLEKCWIINFSNIWIEDFINELYKKWYWEVLFRFVMSKVIEYQEKNQNTQISINISPDHITDSIIEYLSELSLTWLLHNITIEVKETKYKWNYKGGREHIST